jgi:uncharacterized membrane protein YkoI
MLAVGLIACASFVTGCADATQSPVAPNPNPATVDATVQISDPVSSQEADSVRILVRRNSGDTTIISPDQIITIIITQNPDYELLGVNLDYDSDTLSYECVVRKGGKVYVVVIDPKAGTVKEQKEITEYYYPEVIYVRHITVKPKEAKDRAKKLTDGDVVECNLEQIDDRPTYVIVILTRDNRYVTTYVDCETGRERKLKSKGDCDDEGGDGHKNKHGRGHYRHGRGHGYGHMFHCHCSCGDGNGSSDTTKIPTGAIKADSANYIASHMIDSLKVTETKIDSVNDSTAYYNIKGERDSNRYEIKLNAFTGKLVSIKQVAGNFTTSEYTPKVQGDTLVPMSVARTVAVGKVTGTIQMWKLEYDTTQSKWIYTFSIVETSSGTVKEVTVDAKTGAYIATK